LTAAGVMDRVLRSPEQRYYLSRLDTNDGQPGKLDMKELKRGARRFWQTGGVARLRAAARILFILSFTFNLPLYFGFSTANAQTTSTQDGGAQDQRGIGLKPDAQQKQATPEPAQPRGARPELVLQTGYAVMAATGLSFSPDGRLLATYSGMFSGQVKLWDVATGHELRTLAADTGGADFVGGGVRSVAFSRDGRLVAAGSDDGSTKVWDVATGRELYKLGGDNRGTGDAAVYRIAFSPDDRALIALGSASAKFWDLTTGQLSSEMEGVALGSGAIYGWGGLAVTPDGGQVLLLSQATGQSELSIKFVEIATGREARSIEVPHWDIRTNAVGSLALTPDGHVLSADWELTKDMSGARHVKLHDLTAQKEHQLFDLPAGKYASMNFSPDARLLATTVGNSVRLWDTATGAQVRGIEVPSLPSRLMPDSYVWSTAFSPDSQLLATTDSDTQITLWDAATGRAVRSLAGHVNYTYEAAFSADGTRLLTGGKTVWDVVTGRGLRASAVDSPAALAQFSRDGRLVAERALTGSNSVALYDAQSHKLLYTLAPAERADLNQVVFSPDGRFVATSYRLDPTQVQARVQAAQSAARIDPKELMKIAQQAAKNSKNNPNAYTQAYAQLMAARMGGSQTGLESQVKIWDTSTGKEVRSLSLPPANPFVPGMVEHIAFSGDGHTLAASTFGTRSVRLFDVTTGQQVGELGASPASGAQGAFGGTSMDAGDERVISIAFSPDGHLVAVGGKTKENSFDPSALVASARAQGGKRPTFDPKQLQKQIMEGEHAVSTVKIFNASGGQQVLSLNLGANDAKALAFSSDSRTLAAASADSTIKLFDAASGTELHTLAGEGENVNSLAFSPDGRLLASTSNEGSTALWDAKTGARLATLISVGDGGDWLVVTPDGLFDGSPSAWNQILWRFGGNTFNVEPVETFFNEFFYPGLLSDIAAGKRPLAPRDIALIDRRQPVVALKSGAGDKVSTRTVNVSVEVTDAPAGAKDVRLFRNGSLVKVWHGDVLKGQASATLEATVPVVAGENRFTAYAFNNDNVKSHDAALEITGDDTLKRAGTAYIVAVGVNSYENAQYNLKYAAADAQDFADELKRQESQLGRYSSVVVVPLLDSEATKANILAALRILAGDANAMPANAPKSLAALKPAQPEDTVAVYFAGHGTAQRNRFYLIPHDLGYAGGRDELDAAGLQTILSHSISDEELQSAFEGLDAGQLLFVIDACNSGQALEAEEKRRGPMNSKGLAQLAYEKGMYILTAAQSYQAALEAAQLGHGLLTYALVEEGLKKGEAETPASRDGQIVVREWFDYAAERVPQMQLQKIREQRGLGLARIGERDVQRPRTFYRREMDVRPLVVARVEAAHSGQ